MARGRPSPLRVLVPMKPLSMAKTRLWAEVPTVQIHGVILMMMDRVVRASVEALGRDACHVIGGDQTVRGVAEAAGAVWNEDPGHDLNSSLWAAMRSAYDEGCAAALFLPGDLPQASVAGIAALDRASEGYTRPVGVRAGSDGGTNALLVPSATAFEPRLGDQSFARHTAAAENKGTPLVELELPELAFDVDSFDDLAWARDNLVGFSRQLLDWQAWLEKGRG